MFGKAIEGRIIFADLPLLIGKLLEVLQFSACSIYHGLREGTV